MPLNDKKTNIIGGNGKKWKVTQKIKINCKETTTTTTNK